MSRFLLGWEFGRGLGHVTPISVLAHRLIERGHEVHAVTKDAYASAQAFGDFSIPCYALPAIFKPRKRIERARSMAETLFNIGFHSADILAVKLAAWGSLIETIRPDALVVNYAPGGILAAKKLSVPVLQFGTGFEIPPAELPIPGFPSTEKITEKRIRNSEKALVRKINNALEALGWTEINSLCEVFTADRDLLVTFPELDHYPDRRGGHYVGPLISTPVDAPPVWPKGGKGAPRIFGYVKGGYPSLDILLECLASLDACILVFATGLSPERSGKYASESLCFSNSPVNLQRACRESDLVICHAGHGTVSTALLNGASLMLMPQKGLGEQLWMTNIITRLRAGIGIPFEAGKAFFEQALDLLLNEDYGAGAAEFQKRHADFEPESAWSSVVAAAEELAG